MPEPEVGRVEIGRPQHLLGQPAGVADQAAQVGQGQVEVGGELYLALDVIVRGRFHGL